MDKLEEFYNENRDEMDHREPPASVWGNINDELPSDQYDEHQIRPAAAARRRYVPYAVAALAAIIVLPIIIFIGFGSEGVGIDESELFPDIVLATPDGDSVSISSLRGKVVLVEFWKSSSVICTEENCYYFEPIYQEYKDKGFEVYAVSLDTNREDWVNGIERDKLPWIQVSDLIGDDSPLVDLCNIEHIDSLPATYLLDQNGRVIDKNVNAHNLRDKLDVLLAQN